MPIELAAPPVVLRQARILAAISTAVLVAGIAIHRWTDWPALVDQCLAVVAITIWGGIAGANQDQSLPELDPSHAGTTRARMHTFLLGSFGAFAAAGAAWLVGLAWGKLALMLGGALTYLGAVTRAAPWIEANAQRNRRFTSTTLVALAIPMAAYLAASAYVDFTLATFIAGLVSLPLAVALDYTKRTPTPNQGAFSR